MRKRYYLAAVTSVGTIHLPCVSEEIDGDNLKLTFNWVTFEEDVTVRSLQPFLEVIRDDGFEDTALGEIDYLEKNKDIFYNNARDTQFVRVVPLSLLPSGIAS
jgi:hypothetical protein